MYDPTITASRPSGMQELSFPTGCLLLQLFQCLQTSFTFIIVIIATYFGSELCQKFSLAILYMLISWKVAMLLCVGKFWLQFNLYTYLVLPMEMQETLS